MTGFVSPHPAFYTATDLHLRVAAWKQGYSFEHRQLIVEAATPDLVDLAIQTQPPEVAAQISGFQLASSASPGSIMSALAQLLSGIEAFMATPAGQAFISALLTGLLSAINL